ncbi:hypothetical protein [Kitasatospora herbaricolor]|uniref:Integrase n=1 Tax=Kitasatospora herbaricolor TaxID=68217 RepID=A0ABZ1W0L2_9ACTN|nr:hypothetical protein [Kitasatospora herbaricolor]
MAAELADEWVEYVAAAGLAAGTVQSYQQAIDRLCVSIDAALGTAAPSATLAVDEPDLGRAVAAWERTLPADYATGSMRPAILAGAIRVLIRRRVEHPDRLVADRVAALARAGVGVPIGESVELDEFSREEKQAMVRGAWAAVIALEKRLAAGWDLASQGRHPDQGSWMSIPDLLWGLAHEMITPREINDHLPPARKWPAELVRCIERPDGTVSVTTAKQALDRWLAAQLWPTSFDLHAFRVLLVDATGRAPEEVSVLAEDDVEFMPGGVRLTLVKLRAKRRYYRSFKDASLEMAEVIEREEFKDWPRREPGVVVRRLMDVTERARLRAADSDGRLFIRACVEPDLTLRFSEWSPDAPGARFVEWLRRHQITVSGGTDIRRLRKSTKVEKVIVSRGHLADAADDHYEETFRGHYAQGTTLRVISAEVINTAQEHWLGQALEGPTVLTPQAAESAEGTTRLQALGLSEQEANDLIQGELDMGVTNCKNPYESPFSPAGELCAVAPLRCLECRNAWVLPSQLPQLLLFGDHLDKLRQRLSPKHFTALWGQSNANLRAVLDDRSEGEKILARKHIAEGAITLNLPLAAHVEFDA